MLIQTSKHFIISHLAETWWSKVEQLQLAVTFDNSLSHLCQEKEKQNIKPKNTHPVTLGKVVEKKHLPSPETGERWVESCDYTLEVCIFWKTECFVYFNLWETLPFLGLINLLGFNNGWKTPQLCTETKNSQLGSWLAR